MTIFDKRSTNQGEALAHVRRRAEGWITAAPSIPAAPGGWMHDFVCPEHHAALGYNLASPHAHGCPLGHALAGPTLDAAWRVHRHRELAEAARDLGLAFAASGEPAAAAAAQAILQGYADAYAGFGGAATARPWMLTGHVFQQALTEALWTVPIIQAYELIRPTLDPAADATICAGLLRPIAATLTTAQDRLVHEQGKLQSNYNAWLIAALGLLGYALGDRDLVAREVGTEVGLRAHLAAAILPDGFEYEGSTYYHTFVSLAYSLLAERAAADGQDLYAISGPEGQSIAATWRALADLALPDGSFPALNDGAYWAGGPFDAELCDLFEIAYARSGEPRYAWLLDRAYARRGQDRDRWAALACGRELPVAPEPPALPSTCLPQVGIAVLRGAGLAAVLPFGPDGGSHTHADRLALTVWPCAPDAGTPPYGDPARAGWYATTAAHAALLVDGAGQQIAPGELLAWNSTSDGGAIHLATSAAFADVRVERMVEVAGSTLHDIVLVASEREHSYTWLLPFAGDLELAAPLHATSDRPALDDALASVAPASHGRCDGRLLAHLRCNGQIWRISIDAGGPCEVSLGHAPASPVSPSQPRSMLALHLRGQSARVAMTISGEERDDA